MSLDAYKSWLSTHMLNGGEYVDLNTYYATISPESRGLGDSVAKVIHATGLNKVSEMYTSITGKPCNCKGRQEFLNDLVPYGESHAR